MTIGEIIDSFVAWITEGINNLPNKEKIDEIIESSEIIKTIIEIPEKMADSFTELFSGKQWGWILAFVFCAVSAVILWRSLADVMNFLGKVLLILVGGLLLFAIAFCILIERLDVAVLILLFFIVMTIMRHFYPKPPEDKK